MQSQSARNPGSHSGWLVPVWPALIVAILLLWVFWPTLEVISKRWISDVEYSHGYLVPVFSAYLLWSRRGRLSTGSTQPSWLGLPVLAVGLTMRFAGTYMFLDWLAGVSLIPCLAGIALLAGGKTALRWSWPAIAFLVFMIPLPFRVEVALAQPLQHVATVASTYALQTLGFNAFAEGNVIRMGQIRIGVVEACSGLSMLLVFFALATAVAMVVQRPWLDKTVLLVSAVPVAILANVIRITVTGILHKVAGQKIADLVFHDLAGWLMMPLALGLLWAELRLLAWVFPTEDAEPKRPLPKVIPKIARTHLETRSALAAKS